MSLPSTKRVRKIVKTILDKNNLAINKSRTRELGYSDRYRLPDPIKKVFDENYRKLRTVSFEIIDFDDDTMKKAEKEIETMLFLSGLSYRPEVKKSYYSKSHTYIYFALIG